MSLTRETMMSVMSYVDGELDGEARDRIEALLATDDEASRLASELRTLGDCVRVVHTDRKLEKNPDDIADDVMAKLEKRVAPIGSLSERRRNASLAAIVCGTVAIAAGWWLFMHAPRPDDNTSAQVNPTPVVTSPGPVISASMPSAQVAVATPPAEGADVESVESDSHEVSVFYVPAMASSNPNASSVVVWIDEGEAKK